ncbi:reverse transcriptase domain-containing protein [Tanacetum coccineum]
MLKILVEGGVITLKSSKLVPLECALVSGPEETSSATKPIIEERVKIAINPEYLEQTVMIGSTFTEEGRNKLCGLLQHNLDIFAWKPADMNGVPRHIAEHCLNVRERGVPDGIMKEIHYHDWLSNPVMVKKHDDSWRMCVNFKDLNKACLKDGYPLPKINWKVESLCEFPFKCFLDAYKGYHQIQIAKEDEEKTAFITSQGILCYTKMPFGLRNAGATYQCLMDKAFHKQIGRNLEVYVDDLVIKSRTENEIVRDIEETFKTLREINMKLNPKKYTFGVEEGMFPGYKVNSKGLKVCPDKVDAVLGLPSLKCLKDVQKLNGKLASLNRALRGPELNYTSMEKLVLALVHASKRLKRIAKQIGVKNLQANVDSRLVANQVNGTYVAKEVDMIHYMEKVKALTGSFKAFTIKQIPRSENKKADALSKIASTSFAHLSKQVLVKELKENSISKVEVLAVIEEEGDTWMTPIFKYLAEDTLPTYVKKARAIRRKSWRFTVVNGIIYKKSFLGPWLRCIGPLQASYTNGLVERANRSLGERIKARLEARSKNWMEEELLPCIFEINLDLLEERREETAIREAKSKAKVEKYYNSKVRNTSFKPGDLVYRNNVQAERKTQGS